MSDLDSVKAMCRSVLMCSSYGVPASKFPKEYEDTTGMVLPMKALGVRNVNDLPRLMPDVMKAERNGQGMIIFYVVVNEKIAHIARMKSKEKTKSKKNRRPIGAKKVFYASENGGGPVRANSAMLDRGKSSVGQSRPYTPASRPISSASRPAVPAFRPAAPASRPASSNSAYNRPAPSAARPVAKPAPPPSRSYVPPQSRTNQYSSQPARQPVASSHTPAAARPSPNIPPAVPRSAPARNLPPPRARISVPAESLCTKVETLMRHFVSGLWSGHLVSEYESFFKEAAEPNLLDLVLQMEGRIVRVDRPHGKNSNKVILYGLEEEEEEKPSPKAVVPSSAAPVSNGKPTPTKFKYPYTYRYTHAPLPWLGIRSDCYVTLAHSPSYFWIQVKSPQLDDLNEITDLIQTSCETAPPESHGKFLVDELVCALYEDGMWYRAIVLDVGSRKSSVRDGMDPALFLPGKPMPQFKWEAGSQVKLFFVDYGNIEWMPLSKVRRKKFPYPSGQAFRCSLGSITPTNEWARDVCEKFKEITEKEAAENLRMTVESVKSDKAHYGFKSRLNEYCQKRKLDMAEFDRPLNSDRGWRTCGHIRHPTKGKRKYEGFYQNKKNDAEASAAQRIIRDWDITLLESQDIPAHWMEVVLENTESGEVYNMSLVEGGFATPKTSVYDIVIPSQPDPKDIPILESEMKTYAVVEISDSEESEEEGSFHSCEGGAEVQEDPELVALPEVGSVTLMTVTHVLSPRNICVRNVDGKHDKTLMKLEDNLTDHMMESPKSLTNVQVNELCAVYSEKVWYRGRVLRLLRDNRAEVLMLDYGDTQKYPVSELCYLEPQFLTLPYQAISCSLHGLEKLINEADITRYIEKKIEEKTFLVKTKDIVNERTLSVELYDQEKEYENGNMNELFLSQDIRNLKPDLPGDGDRHVVSVTNVAQDGIISLQIHRSGLSSLAELMKELRTYYEETPSSASDYIVAPRVGQICCSFKVDEDGERKWYRTMVNRPVDDHTVEVQYVDYGNTGVIPKSKLREPARAVPNITRLPFQAYPVRLADLPTGDDAWSSKEIDTINGYLSGQHHLEAELVENTDSLPLVRIYFSSGNNQTELNRLLSTDRNLFQRPDPVQSVARNLANVSLANPVFISPTDIVLDQSNIPKLSLQRESEAMISHVEHPYCWFFQSRAYLTAFAEMGAQMNAFYSQPTEYDDITYKQHNLCVAFCSNYGGWYRARVLRASPQEVYCSMVDYGDEQTIPLSNIRPLVSQFATIPIQACKAALEGVRPADGSATWSDEAKRFFSAAISEKMLWVRLTGQDPKTQVLKMHIIDTTGDTDVFVSESLKQNGLAVDGLALNSSTKA